MPALSFQEEWIDKLLSGSKQQTTRPQTDRIKVGDVCSIYNQQRRKITDKMMLCTTPIGEEIILAKIRSEQYPAIPDEVYVVPEYYAHFLGKVEITEVYERTFDMMLIRRSEHEWRMANAWALSDGFKDFWGADTWFTAKYGDDWMQQTWTVIRWNGWLEKYFLEVLEV